MIRDEVHRRRTCEQQLLYVIPPFHNKCYLVSCTVRCIFIAARRGTLQSTKSMLLGVLRTSHPISHGKVRMT